MLALAAVPARSHALAAVAVCGYLGTFALPFNANVPVLILALFSTLSGRLGGRAERGAPLQWAVAFFLAATALSTVGSADPARSLRLSAPIVPATLLFFLLARQRDMQLIRRAYVTCSFVTLAVSVAVVWTAARGDWHVLHAHVAAVGTPLLVEANDIACAAVLAPLSFALLASTRRGLRALGLCAIVAAISAICVLRSRTAFLTLLLAGGTYTCLATQSHRVMWRSLAVILAGTLLVDASIGFPLVSKFQKLRDQRVPLAFTSVGMFVDAPVLGHGPHSFASVSGRYANDPDWPRWVPPLRQSHRWAHNLYLEFLAERGVAGFAALVLLIALAFRKTSGIHRDPDPGVGVLAAGLTASLAAFCFAGILESSFLRLWVVVVFFSLLGIASQLSRHKESVVNPW